MDLGIKGETALVTGAGRGIGHAIAQGLIREGCRVVAVSRSFPEAESGDDPQPGFHRIPMNLEEEGACEKVRRALVDDGLCPGIIVNNLGGTVPDAEPLGCLQDWRRSYRLNLETAVELNNLFLPGLRERRRGRIVHISSISALEAQGHPTYCAMKAALMAYTRSLGRSVCHEGIAVSAVLPGAVLTEGGYWELAGDERPEHVDRFLRDRMAIGRFGSPEEIAALVVFLCSKWSSFVAGSSFLIDGGQGRSYLTV